MAFTPTPYIPQVYQRPELLDRQSAGRLADLVRAQGSAQARGIRDSANASAQMWGTIGQGVGNALSQLTSYYAEKPKLEHEQMLRNEQAGQIRKQHNLEAVDRMAGEGGLDEDARADLYDQAGFHKEAVQARDANRQRKAQIFQQTQAELGVQRQRMSEGLDQLRGITKISTGDPMADIAEKQKAYQAILPSLKEAAGKQYEQFVPFEYDDKTANALIEVGASRADRLAWQQQAAAAAALLHGEEQTEQNRQKYGRAAVVSFLRSAGDKDSYDRAWAAIDGDKSIPENVKQQFPREFSPKAMQTVAAQAEALNPDKQRSEIELNVEAFVTKYGRKPGPEEMLDITRKVNATHFNPAAYGASQRALHLTAAQKTQIERWKANEYAKLEARRIAENLSDEDMDTAKEQIQAGYLNQLGIEGGPTLTELAGARGQNISGKPLSALAAPAGAPAPQQVGPPTPPPQNAAPVAPPQPATPPPTQRVSQTPPRPDAVLIEGPHGEPGQWFTPQDAAIALAHGGKQIGGAPLPSAQPPAAPAAVPPPSAPPSPSEPSYLSALAGNVAASNREPGDEYVPARPLPPLINVNAARANVVDAAKRVGGVVANTAGAVKDETKRAFDVRGNAAELQRKIAEQRERDKKKHAKKR